MVLFFRIKPKKCNKLFLQLFLLYIMVFLHSCKTAKINTSAAVFPTLGEQIRSERINRGLSQKELAAAVDISSDVLNMVEDGLATPMPSKVTAIQEYLGIELVYSQNTSSVKK